MFENTIIHISDIYYTLGYFILFTLFLLFSLSERNKYLNTFINIYVIILCCLINVLFLDINYNDGFILNSCVELTKLFSDFILKYNIYIFIILFFIYTFYYMYILKYISEEYLIIIYLSILSICLFIFSSETFIFYLLLEIFSLCFYILTAFYKHKQYCIESGLKYFILSSFSSIILLYGFTFLYGISALTNFFDYSYFYELYMYTYSNHVDILLSIIFILVPLLFKLYAAPFHFWIGDIYQGSPFITATFFATVTSLPLYYVFYKLVMLYFNFIVNYLFFFLFYFQFFQCYWER